MKGRNAVCVFCRHNALIKKPIRASQRWRTTTEPFVLPRVVIVLDAADNKNVKQFEEMSKEEKKLNLDGHVPPRTFQKVHAATKGYNRPPRLHIKSREEVRTPSDLLSYALAGDLADAGHVTQPSYDSRRRKYSRQSHDESARIMRDLASGFVVDGNQRLVDHGFDFSPASIETLHHGSLDARNLRSLRDVFSQYSTTKEGCEVLAERADFIAKILKRVRKNASHTPLDPVATLQVLNNLRLAMESKCVEFHPLLASRAMYYATQVPTLAIVRLYLTQYGNVIHENERYIRRVPVELAGIVLETEMLAKHSGKDVEDRRMDALSVLTGWTTGSPTPDEQRQPSIGTMFANDALRPRGMNEVHQAYICAITQLGLLDLLTTEVEKSRTYLQELPENRAMHILRFSHWYALAYTLAGDIDKARQLLELRPPSEQQNHRTTKVERHQFSDFLWNHYRSLKLHLPPELKEKIQTDFKSIPADTDGALALFERYLIRDYSRGHLKNDVGIREVDGQDVLVVLDSRFAEGGDALYAKALGPSSAVATEAGSA